MFLVGRKVILGRAIFLVMFLAGCGHSACLRKTGDGLVKPAAVPILLYHHVRDLPDTARPLEKRWSVSIRKFAGQMKWLAEKGFHPVSMTQLVAHFQQGQPLPAKPVVITFDDGWKDQYEGAFPILKQHQFVATFFIITGAVGHSAYMDWEQIKEIEAAGMDIQAHGHTHERLSTMSRDKARQEIEESKRALEDHLSRPVTVLAYPYGSYDDAVIAEVKAAGFAAAVTIGGRNGGYLFRADQTYTMTRYGLEGDDNLAAVARFKRF